MARYPFILPPRSQDYRTRHRVEELFRNHGLAFQVVMESSNVELSSLYVGRGLGISFATVRTDVPEPAQVDLSLIPLDQYFPVDHIAVVMRTNQALPRHKQGFLDLLLENVKG
jgi:DNA-binding transcriptional LysR family regulator